jgi:hypothetical protein
VTCAAISSDVTYAVTLVKSLRAVRGERRSEKSRA